MNCIVLTSEQKAGFEQLRTVFYQNSHYGSYENFKEATGKNIDAIEIQNELYILPAKLLSEESWVLFSKFVFDQLTTEIVIREVPESEFKESDL